MFWNKIYYSILNKLKIKDHQDFKYPNKLPEFPMLHLQKPNEQTLHLKEISIELCVLRLLKNDCDDCEVPKSIFKK